MRKLALVCALVAIPAGSLLTTGLARAADPSSNFVVRPNCSGDASCLAQAIRFLDSARASLGEPAYQLPRDFASLDAARQAFVLTDLDRELAGLRPITGLTFELDQAAAAGVRSGADPVPTDPNVLSFASNWAGGYLDMAFAYEAWMYDDGPGSDNLDCTALIRSGCWQHRHDILSQFGGSGALALGVAAGLGPGAEQSYTLLLAQMSPGSNPVYTYTWREAVAAGAGGSVPLVSWRPRRAAISCARSRRRTHHRRHHRSARCSRR